MCYLQEIKGAEKALERVGGVGGAAFSLANEGFRQPFLHLSVCARGG